MNIKSKVFNTVDDFAVFGGDIPEAMTILGAYAYEIFEPAGVLVIRWREDLDELSDLDVRVGRWVRTPTGEDIVFFFSKDIVSMLEWLDGSETPTAAGNAIRWDMNESATPALYDPSEEPGDAMKDYDERREFAREIDEETQEREDTEK